MLTDVQDYMKILDASDKHPHAIEEHAAYCYVLFEAYRTPQAAFHKSARTDLTCVHLFTQPKKYRGEVVHLEGWKLRRLLRFDDPPPNVASAGLKEFYEGWIYNAKAYGPNPVCVLFTELPAGLKVGESLSVPVSFDGYFFKRYRYKAGDSNKGEARDAPLLIGHTLTLAEPVEDDEATASFGWGVVLTGFMGFILFTIVVLLGFAWWFRKDDRQIQARLDRQKTLELNLPEPEGDAEAVAGAVPPVASTYPVESANGGNGHTAGDHPAPSTGSRDVVA